MPVRFCHIAPTKFIPDVAKYNKCFLSLAHLIEQDRSYIAAHLDAYQDRVGITKIMDNSAFEMYKQNKPMFPSDKLIELGKRIDAEYIVMSDYPNQDWEVTKNAAIELGPKLHEAGFKTFYCPQAPIGNIKDLLKSFQWASKSEHVDYIGVSILAIPNAFGVEKGNALQRFLSRYTFMKLIRSHGILHDIKASGKKIHFLGMTDGPKEIEIVKDYLHYIDSWDSSSAVWHGYNGILFDDSPTGLIRGKLETEVDFDVKEDDNRDKIMFNVQYINGLLEVNDV